MHSGSFVRSVVFLLGMLTLSRVLERKGARLEGSFMGVPYDLRPPTSGRLKERLWNPDDPRIFTPHFYGIGWSVNFYSLAKRAARLFV